MTSFSINLANIAPAKQHSFLFIYSVKTNFYNLNALCIFAPQKVKSNLSFEKEQEKKNYFLPILSNMITVLIYKTIWQGQRRQTQTR